MVIFKGNGLPCVSVMNLHGAAPWDHIRVPYLDEAKTKMNTVPHFFDNAVEEEVTVMAIVITIKIN